MNYFLRSSIYNSMYNCTNLDVDSIPLEQRKLYKPEAIVTICLCAFYYTLYIPCVISISKHLDNACYKLLFYISVTDLMILWILGFMHGILQLQGAVYCTYPTTIYLAGVAVTSVWSAESVAEIILSINRCISILSPNLAHSLFDGRRTWYWLSLTTCYALFWFWYAKPVLFTALHFGWFFNPYQGYIEDKTGLYENRLHTVHDLFMAGAIPSIYLLFGLAFFIKTRGFTQIGDQTSHVSGKQKMTFLQIAIISALNMTACSIYVYMMYFTPSQGLITLGQFCWFHIHGFPPVIYLSLNTTIRSDTKNILKKLVGQRRTNNRVGGLTTSIKSEAIRPSNQQSSPTD